MRSRCAPIVLVTAAAGVTLASTPCRRAAAQGGPAPVPSAIAECWGKPNSVSNFGPDDLNCSRISPALPGSAPFVGVSVVMAQTAFTPANHWTFVPGRSLEGRLTVNEYFPWVVNSPTVTGPPPANAPYRLTPPLTDKDVGGAAFAMTYDPEPGDPPANAIHFLQVYSEQLDGGPTTYHLDNHGSADTPFYDRVPGATVERPGNGTAWFLDIPFECENHAVCANEGIEHHWGRFQFGVYLAVDDFDGLTHTVTVHGGKRWGYLYATTDCSPPLASCTITPEPPTALLLGGGASGLAVCASRRRRRLARA